MQDEIETGNENWRKVKLGKLLRIETGRRPSGGVLTIKNGIPSIGAEHLDDRGGFNLSSLKYIPEDYFKKSTRGKIKENDILVVKDGATIGKVSRVSKYFPFFKAMVNEHVFIVRSSNENLLNQTFLFYKIFSREGKETIKSSISGSAQGGLKKDFLDHWETYIPPLSIQKRIAEILSAFDEKIELNNKINQILEEMAQAIFKERLLKNQRSKTKNQRIRDLTEIISGYPFKSKLYTKSQKGTLGVVTIKNVQDGDFITHCDSFIKKEEVPENMNSECFIKNGDILLSLTGNVGRVCFVYGGEYLLNQRVAKLKPINQKDRALVYFLFRQKSMQSLLINMAKGSAQPNLSPVETGEIEINLPYRDVLDKFAEIVNPIYDYLVQNKVENQKLSALRDLFLPKLMSGE